MRRVLAAALELVVLVAGAAAVVLALGAQARARIGGTLILMGDPWRPFIVASGAALLRAVTLRDVPVGAWAHRGEPARQLGSERQRFAAPVPMSSAARRYAAAAALVSVVWLTPHLLHPRRVPDADDPVFSAWRIARFVHQLTHDPAHLFDGYIFHPAPLTLTYSDATVLQGLAATPFIVAGTDPLLVSNLLFLSAFPLCALGFFYAGWRLTAHPRAAFMSGVLGALYPFHFEHYSHLELQFFFFVPLATVALLRLLAAPSWKTGLLFGALVALQWLASMYFGVMMAVFLLPFAIVVTLGWRVGLTARLAGAIAAAMVPITIAVAVVAVPYLSSQAARGDRSLRVVDAYSAKPADYGRPNASFAAYRRTSRMGNQPERELFPGATTLALAAIGGVPPLAVPAIAVAVATPLVFDASLGTHGLMYDDLYRWMLPFRGMRVPARFSVLVGTGLILLAAYGCRRIFELPRRRHTRAAMFAAVSLAAVFELRPAIHLEDYPSTVPSVYAGVTPSMVLAEFPMRPDANIRYMYFSTRHWARMVNGYSGYIPDTYMNLQRELEGFPSTAAIERLKQEGVTHVTVNCALLEDPAACPALLASLDRTAALQLVSAGRWEKADVRLYALR